MTQEEKAKAYDEALKWMRELYPGLHGATKEDAEHYLPQLRESEDEKIRKELIEFIQWSEDRGMTRHDFHQAKRPAEWIDWLEKQKEQKPAEWSEEDEKMRNLAIEWAETMSGQCSFVDMDSMDFRKIATWLKSLRPSWKPSKEQMEALQRAIDACESEWAYQDDELRSLLNDLNKL